jgi:hypothetical protein
MIVNQPLSAGRCLDRTLHLPARARTDQAQISKAKIQHGAGDRANILA